MKRLLITLLFVSFCFNLFATNSFAKSKDLTLTATASSVYYNSSYYGAEKTVDGNVNTYWIGERDASPWWITFDAGSVTTIDDINIIWYSYANYIPDNYDILISDDNVNWTTVFTGIQGSSTETRSINQEARYIKFQLNSVPYYFPVLKEVTATQELNIPKTIRFQGNLKDSAGAKLDGTYAITFSIYDTDTGGVALWQETHQALLIENGLLDVELGSVSSINLAFDAQYWLGVQVETDEEMSPRFKFSSVPYSFVTSE